MTNQEVKQFFLDNGAYYDFEITSIPVFNHYYIVHKPDGNAELMNKMCCVGIVEIKDIHFFIFNSLNDPTKKWYIYNDMNTDFNLNIQYIRAIDVCKDDILKQRFEKLKKIKERINKKQFVIINGF